MGSQSLFAVVHYFDMENPYYSILELDLEYPPETTEVDEKAVVKVIEKVVEKVRFNLRQEPFRLSTLSWVFSPPKSYPEDLYMVPIWRFGRDDSNPLNGHKFNFSTGSGSFLPINLPKCYEYHTHVVNMRGNIYLISHDWYWEKRSFFHCYDPANDSWEPLPPLPIGHKCRIVATAVWGDSDTILLIVSNGGGGCIWAYERMGNKWSTVKFDHLHRITIGSIVGEAVVQNDTIYALTDCSVLVLSIKKNVIDDELVSSLLKETDLDPIYIRDRLAGTRTWHLLHLGENKFCVVESCIHFVHGQCMRLTYLKIMEDNSATVMGRGLSNVQIQHYMSLQPHSNSFRITRCFSLPKGNTTVLKQAERLDFTLDPCTLDNLNSKGATTSELDNDSSQTNIIDQQGRSIYVRNLPPNPTVGQLEKRLKKFGPIKRDGIQIGKDNQGKLFAYVEFESTTSKQLAIQASTIQIGKYAVNMLEKRVTGPTLVDCKSEGSSSIAKNKFKNHGKVSLR